MVTMDELARKKAGVKPDGEGGDRATADPMADLESAINKLDSMEAKELLRAKARVLRANMELQAREAEQRLQGGRPPDNKPAEVNTEAKRDQVAATAMALLEKGMPANVVGEYLRTGLSGNIPISFGGQPGGQQGLQLSDIKTIMEMVNSGKGTDPNLTIILNKMNERLDSIEQNRRPVEAKPAKGYVYRQDATGAWKKEELEPGETLLIPTAQVTTGKSIEEIKEENRHAEELEKMKADKDYKEKIAGVVAELPERIGAGLAGRVMDQEEAAAPAARTMSTKMEYFKCKGDLEGKVCGYDIPIPPGATLQVTCPKCGTIYSREEK